MSKVKVRLVPICRFCSAKTPQCNCSGEDFKGKPEVLPAQPNGTTAEWEYGWAMAERVVKARDKGTCQRCKRQPLKIDIHHIHRRDAGGSDHPRNLISLCKDCHKATFNKGVNKLIQKEHEKKQNIAYWGKFLGGKK